MNKLSGRTAIVTGGAQGLGAAICRRLAQEGATVIQINSKSGKRGSAKNSAYAANKFGGFGLTQSLALELAEHGIRVNAIMRT